MKLYVLLAVLLILPLIKSVDCQNKVCDNGLVVSCYEDIDGNCICDECVSGREFFQIIIVLITFVILVTIAIYLMIKRMVKTKNRKLFDEDSDKNWDWEKN
jgi:hypothetical protein